MDPHEEPLQVTPDTKVGAVLSRYGDIAKVMAAIGVKPVGPYNIRRLVGRFLTVRRAAKIHKLETDEMVELLQRAINQVHSEQMK